MSLWSRAFEEICGLWGLQHKAITPHFHSAVLFCVSLACDKFPFVTDVREGFMSS